MTDYRQAIKAAGIGRTATLCQDALIEMLEELFDGHLYSGQEGKKALKVYRQDLPIPEELDVDVDTDEAAAPYIVVRMIGGEIANDRDPQTVEFQLVICTYDTSLTKDGYQEVSNIKEDIIQRVCSMPYFGGAFTVLKPVTWAMQTEDSAPYYYGACLFSCTAPAMTQDTVLGDLI